MCLLIVLSRAHPDTPLGVAANRDEWLERPAEPVQALRPAGPRVLGGRDVLGGGTWLAVNEHGVVAALTNRPSRAGREGGRRSRGALPLLLGAEPTAAAAAATFVRAVRPHDFNPCWLMVGDRTALFYLEIGDGEAVAVRELSPGLWVLENRRLGAPSPKADAVREALSPASSWRGPALLSGLKDVLRNHRVPDLGADGAEDASGLVRPIEAHAPCVHAGPYGTRSSSIVLVPPDPTAAPAIHFADGPPCTTPFQDATGLWRGGTAA